VTGPRQYRPIRQVALLASGRIQSESMPRDTRAQRLLFRWLSCLHCWISLAKVVVVLISGDRHQSEKLLYYAARLRFGAMAASKVISSKPGGRQLTDSKQQPRFIHIPCCRSMN